MSKGRLYIAYGSNLNLEQMEHRCPTVEVMGTAMLKNWRLRFRGGDHSAVATIERERKGSRCRCWFGGFSRETRPRSTTMRGFRFSTAKRFCALL